MSGECEARLLKLQQYVPFLQRTKEYYISSPDEIAKIAQLINIISSAGEQLRPETLERCEKFCRILYSKFGREDELKLKKGNSSNSNQEKNRYESPPHFRASANHETPRSPSPDESERFSQQSVPKAIPNQRSDPDLRHNSTISRQEIASRDNYRRSPIADHPSRPLRTEPIEIPTMAIHTGKAEGFSNQDKDYRTPYDQSMINGRLSLDDRRVTYNRGSPDGQHGGTSFPKRETRFDRYGGDRSSLNVGRPYEEPLHSNNQPKMVNHWDSQPGWESHSRDRSYSGERDRPFQSRGSSSNGPSSARPGSRWDSSNSQHSRHQHFPSSRSHDTLREPISGQHAPPNSYRNGESSTLPNSRMDRQSVRHEPSIHGSKSWSSRDQSSNSHNFDRDSRNAELRNERNYRQNEIPPRHGLLPLQSSSGFPVPNVPVSSSVSQPAPRVPNYPANAVSPQQLNPTATSSSQGPSRREDPRLANRTKPAPVRPSPTTSLLPLTSPPQTGPVVLTPPVVVPQKFSTPPMPALSRFGDQRDNPNRPLPIKPPTDQPKGNQKMHNKETDVRKEAEKQPTNLSGNESITGSSSRSPDEFVSPLNSLYSGTSNSSQTGRGYGVQSYKIPKKKTLVSHSKGVTKPAPPCGTAASTMISSESSESLIETATRVTTNNDGLKTTIGSDEKESNQSTDDLPIPLETLENFLKKKLPSDDAKMVLERLKTKTSTELNEPSMSPSSVKKTEESRVSDSDSGDTSMPAPGVDTTASSSGDNFTLAMSEDEGMIDVNDKTGALSKTVTSSDHQDSTESFGKKKGRGRKSVPLEVARLREDLTDFMKGTTELGTRRCRSKSQPALDGTTEEEKGAGHSEKPAVQTAKRGRKRKGTANERDLTAYTIGTPSEEGNETVDDFGSVNSSSAEPNKAMESPMEFPNPLRGKTCTRGRKRKGASRGRKGAPTLSSSERSPDEPSNKARKKKTPLIPTHFSLRGRRSMYEDFEPNEQIEEQNNQASGEQYFQCQKCSYLGQKIVHHYVNEHPDLENPHISIPDSEWEAISSQSSPTIPSHYKVNFDLLKDLSWIPTRPNYANPVQCKLCAYSTCKRSELLEHVMIHALPTNYQYRCSLCGLTETNFFDMLDHVTGHTGEFRYRCNYCDFRVAHRAGIKHHMSSMHDSQDELFYTTNPLPEADQVWIFGFICKSCRYFQTSEGGLERHRGLHPECEGHIKVCLITAIQTSCVSKSELVEDSETVQDSTEKEKGVFLCPTLDSVRREDLNEDQLTEYLKQHLTSYYIETLAEKLNKSDEEQISSSTSPARVKDCEPVMAVATKTVAIDEKAESENKEEIQPPVEETPVVTEPPVVAESNQQEIDSPAILAEALLKPNALLETTILKLVDKLGIEAGITTSADFEEEDEEEDVTFEDEEEDEEEEEGEEDDSLEDYDSEIDSEDNSVEEQNTDQAETSKTIEETEEKTTDKMEVAEVHPEEKVASAQTEKIEIEADSSMFLRIENVVSLTEVDEADSLDPITSADYSNVTMAKNEVTFPYCASHDRPSFAARLKDEVKYKQMLDQGRLKNLFKCMAHRCIFSCNLAGDFKTHLDWHNNHFLKPNRVQPIVERRMIQEDEKQTIETVTLPDFFLCFCCPFGARSSSQLVEHVESTHGASLFQCPACFYRANNPKMLSIHFIICHPKMDMQGLNCIRISPTGTACEIDELKWNDLPRYRCCVDDCGFSCILRISFIKHMSTCHNGVKHFCCRLCTKNIICNNSDYTQFFQHMNIHEMGFFQCAFCLWGADLPTDALIHMCLHHPSLEGKVFTRSSQIPSGSKTLLKFWKPGLPHAYTRVHTIDFDLFFRELFSKVEVIERVVLPEEDIVDLSVVVKSQEAEELADASIVVLEEITANEDLSSVSRKEPETEFHGFGEEEQEKAKKQTEFIVIESDVEDDNTASEPCAASQPNEETQDHESEEHQEGLFGRQLYMCGNVGCAETAETASALKDHLMVCDLARDSRLLSCRHCGKNVKQISNLMEHLRSHGVKRFLCGLCSYRANLVSLVRKHMKTLHRVNVVDEVPIGSGPGPVHVENTLLALYPREMVARLKLRSRTSGKKGAVKAYSCRDAKSIPMKSIFPVKIKCSHCGYTSNVRTNMIRHLAMHESSETANATSSEGEEIIPRRLIPDQDPVNPVPHLEIPTKGKMFDKMANLAYSSHVKEKPATKERMSSGIADDTIEKSQQPVFVPDHQRYVCGYHGCDHLMSNENMLKYHVQTLHKTALFSCPHCPGVDEQFSFEAFRSHLKMHGPKLFKCGHCIYFHWQQLDIETHLAEKHPNRPPWQIIIRDPSDPDIKRMQGTNNQSTEKNATTPWNCSLCKQVAATAVDIQVHVESIHGVKNQFKCAYCPVRCNFRSEFDRHFASRHPNQDVQVLTMYYKVETNETSKESEQCHTNAETFEPLWKKDGNRLRHIRGILLEDNERNDIDDIGAGTTIPSDDPVYGPFGSPSNGQYTCPKCPNYRVSYARDLKIHLYRELDYKKFLCSICNEGSWSRALALSHVGKQHPNSGAYIREITSNRAIEEWVGKVIKVQTDALKIFKGTAQSSSKGKKSASVPPSPASSAPSSPIKSPMKPKKTTPSDPTTVQNQQKPNFNVVKLEALADIKASPPKKNLGCLSCPFLADSEQLLEDHVVATHANENTKAGNKICLQCGFKASPKQSLVNHQKKTQHAKTNDLPTTSDDTESESSSSMLIEVDNTVQQPKKGRPKALNPYRCKHCNFSALTEHGMNLHWQRIHSASELPLEFDCDIPAEVTAAKPESVKIYYKCQLCSVQPGLYDEMREHSKILHPNSPAKFFRVTSKVRYPQDSPNADTSKNLGPPAKIVRDEKTMMEIASLSPPVQTGQPPPPKLTIKPSGPSASSQTVFVVAPPPLQVIPAYTCAWCNAKFQQESQVIRHHASHPPNVPLRYTCRDTPRPVGSEASTSTPPKPELAVMEIRFGCPVCPKYFISLVGAQHHVSEHQQAWKCGHCVMLFGTTMLAFQHWKETHPELPGQLESIDSHQLVERLSKGITLLRVQLNMKSLLKDKSIQPAQSHLKEPPGAVKEIQEKSSVETPVPSQVPKSTMVARKSTSTNLFLKENIKQGSASQTSRDAPPSVPEVTRITQS